MAGAIKINLKVILKGGLTLCGIVAMIGAALGDVFTNAPNKFTVVFWVGFLSVCLGGFFFWKFGHD